MGDFRLSEKYAYTKDDPYKNHINCAVIIEGPADYVLIISHKGLDNDEYETITMKKDNNLTKDLIILSLLAGTFESCMNLPITVNGIVEGGDSYEEIAFTCSEELYNSFYKDNKLIIPDIKFITEEEFDKVKFEETDKLFEFSYILEANYNSAKDLLEIVSIFDDYHELNHRIFTIYKPYDVFNIGKYSKEIECDEEYDEDNED